jgi:cytochrome c oxidase subunit 4
MSSTHDNAHTQHVITPARTYFTVFAILFVATILTYLAALQDFGWLNTPIALGIAFTKASLVVIYFMGVRYNTPLTKVVVVAGFFWLLIMFGLTMGDYVSRTWIGVPGR